MALTALSGKVSFKVSAQSAMPPWQQKIVREALARDESPPEALRFQCRMAVDARSNFARIDLTNGENISLHPRSKPQFGKNKRGLAYLTVTVVYSGDGESYRLQWAGDAVPKAMKRTAVKHDEGRAVAATTISLDLAKATVQPAWKAHGRPAPMSARAYSDEYAMRKARDPAGREPQARRCARLIKGDL